MKGRKPFRILARRVARLVTGAIVAVSVLTGGAALALVPPLPCGNDAYGMSSSEIKSWDKGLILASYYWRGEGPADEDWKETALMRLIDCNSGAFILVSRPPYQEDRYNLSERHARVVDALAEDEGMTLAKFKRKMSRAGAIVSRYSDNEESCSCSVIFPELRGNKKPFRGTDG